MCFGVEKRQNMKRALNCTREFTTHFTFQVTRQEFALEVGQTTQCGKSKNSSTHCTWHIELIKLLLHNKFPRSHQAPSFTFEVRKKKGGELS